MKSLILLTSAAAGASAQFTKSGKLTAAITVDGYTQYQKMIGGGCSGAFGIACNQVGNSSGLSPANQDLVTQILFDENMGALSLLRNIVGSSAGATILPTCPESPAGPFDYSFPAVSNDTCQLQLTQTALKYNPDLFVYADAWSAPGCFKSNGEESDGGYICGVRGTNCTYDWRQSYADYLVQYVRFYEERGVNISMLGAYNEPDFNPVYYSSMQSDGFQAKDFLEVLYPTVKAAYPDVLVSCCDATGARQERDILYELSVAGGTDLFDVNTYHNYQSEIKQPFNNLLSGQPSIMTEWADGTGAWAPTWDVTGDLAEGFQWALYMHNAFIKDASGWTHWWCAQATTGDNALIRLDGNSYSISARLWAFAQYFRFARPNAVRVGAQSSVEEVYVTAWVNTNGTVAVPVVNAAHYPYQLTVDLVGLDVSRATVYVTDNGNNVTRSGRFTFANNKFQATVGGRSMTTFYLDVKGGK